MFIDITIKGIYCTNYINTLIDFIFAPNVETAHLLYYYQYLITILLIYNIDIM